LEPTRILSYDNCKDVAVAFFKLNLFQVESGGFNSLLGGKDMLDTRPANVAGFIRRLAVGLTFQPPRRSTFEEERAPRNTDWTIGMN
jgi:hypothetical protein